MHTGRALQQEWLVADIMPWGRSRADAAAIHQAKDATYSSDARLQLDPHYLVIMGVLMTKPCLMAGMKVLVQAAERRLSQERGANASQINSARNVRKVHPHETARISSQLTRME